MTLKRQILHPVASLRIGINISVCLFFALVIVLQWSVSLCDIRHAHDPAGGSAGEQDH